MNTEKKIKKILLVSQYTPPVLEGIVIMLYNLFRFFPPDSVCMFTDDPSKRKSKKDEHFRLPFKHYIARVPNFSFWFVRSANLVEFLRCCWLPLTIFRGIRVIMKEKIDVIFSLNGAGHFLVAAYYLHRITKKPLYIYMFDLWSKILSVPFARWVAQIYEKRILRSTEKVFVMSEKLADYYKKKYSVESEVIYHSYISCNRKESNKKSLNTEEKPYFDIVFTGFVDPHHEWLQIVRGVLNDFLNDRIRLKLCVPRLDFIEGVESKNIAVESLNRNEVILAQKKADLLFLPMYPRKDCEREILETASPSKLGEYLSSGVPILVFAPEYSYISEYATKEKWGLVVNNFDKEELKNAILRLKNDINLRKSLVSNALRVAANHDAKTLSKKLQQYLLGI